VKEQLLKFSVLIFLLFGFYSPSSSERYYELTNQKFSETLQASSVRINLNAIFDAKSKTPAMNQLPRLKNNSFSEYSGSDHYSASGLISTSHRDKDISEFKENIFEFSPGLEGANSKENQLKESLSQKIAILPNLSSYGFIN
jgi:hypothetical protein